MKFLKLPAKIPGIFDRQDISPLTCIEAGFLLSQHVQIPIQFRYNPREEFFHIG